MPRRDKPAHRFGGDWTTLKLDVVADYLASYTTALKNQSFEKLYVDAFAGTGYRATRPFQDFHSAQEALFPDLAEHEPQALLEGSARRALATSPPFDRYLFIEKSADRCKQLEELRIEFPGLASRIDIHQGDANKEIHTLTSSGWSSRRAVLFLDPYGMNVEWATIEAVAHTRAIDLWLLFPLGIGVNRLLTRSGEIPDAWRKRLDLLLGDPNWYNEFYEVQVERTLFGVDEERVLKAKMETIGRYFVQRLASVFAGVAPQPGVLRNSRNSPLYLLCFAVGNLRGKDIALRIARHLLKDLS